MQTLIASHHFSTINSDQNFNQVTVYSSSGILLFMLYFKCCIVVYNIDKNIFKNIIFLLKLLPEYFPILSRFLSNSLGQGRPRV